MADYLNDLSTYEILRIFPDWEGAISGGFELSQKINRHPGTIDQISNLSDERPFTTDLPFKFFSKEEEYEYTDFFISHKGRWKKFWLPAPHSFFEVDEAITNGQDYIVVKDREFREAHRGHERIWVELKNDDWLTFKILSVVAGPGPDQEKLTLSTTFDRDIQPSEISLCSFIYLGRLDQDVVDFEYANDVVSLSNQKFVELIKEYP